MNKKLIALSAVSMAAMASAAVNLEIWFDGTNQQVNTGGDCMYEYQVCEETTMGYWYDYDDRKNDKGGSYAIYPYQADQYESLVQPMIENLGYATIKYVLVDPTTTGQTAEYPYNFVGFGFNTVGASQDPMDITAAGGLCATYTSDLAVTLEVATPAAGDASCSVTLTKAATPTKADKAIADFKQPTWATEKLPGGCADAFAAATAVKFKLDGQASDAQGQLRIFEVGPKGTCSGAKSAAAEPAFTCKSNGSGAAVCSGDAAINTVKAASAVKATLAGRTLSFGVTVAKAEIVNLQGQVVMTASSVKTMDLSKVQAGVYMVRAAGKSAVMNQKILVK